MSLTRTVAHGTIIQVTGKIISTLLGFVAIALMTRSLGAEQFGWYITASSFLQFVGVLSDFGFTVTTSNMLSEPTFGRSKLLSTIFTWRFITAFIFHGIAPIVFLFFPFAPVIKVAAVIMSASFFFQALNQVFIGLYREQLRMVVAIMGEVVGRVALVFGVALVAAGQSGFLWMMAVISVASLLSTIYFWYYAPPIRFSLDKTIGKALFKKIWPTATAVIFNSLYYQAGRMLLPFYISQTEVGLFGAATRVFDIVVQISALIMGILMPLVTFAWARGQKQDFAERMQLSLTGLSLIILPIIVGMIVLAEPLMVLVAGSDFRVSGLMLQWIGFALFGSCLGMVFGHIALATNHQRSVLWIYISDALISLPAFLIALSLFGWRGAAGVIIFSELYAGVLLTYVTVRLAGAQPSFTPFFKILLACAGMVGVLYLLPPIPLLASVVLGAISYSAFILIFRVISLRTLKLIFSRQKIA